MKATASGFLAGPGSLPGSADGALPCRFAAFFSSTPNHIEIMANVLGVGLGDFPGIEVGRQILDPADELGREVFLLGVHKDFKLAADFAVVYLERHLAHHR